MQKNWHVKPRIKTDLLQQLLHNRGITERETADFLNPDYSKLPDPFLFKDMAKAVPRIWQAIVNKQKILIYSDYDADAITANAVMFRVLQAMGAEPEVYIPDRFSEGYGLNLAAFEKIKALGAGVVITVDCGTNSTAEAEYCKVNGIDLIITDHHELTGGIPDAFAVINPKMPGETYPSHEITGVGVAFKLASALLAKKELGGKAALEIPDGYEKWLLDLVAIGTVADCHSLLGENRILVKYGLQVLAKTKWLGLRSIMKLSGISAENGSAIKTLDTYCLGFIIAPRINAAGRIEHARIAFDLLTADDLAQAMVLAQDLERLNTKRQALTENVMSEARIQILELGERKVLLAVGDNWPKGVVGLVAGKLAEEFARPVLVLERGSAESTGSARSTPNFDIVEALGASKDVLVRYGGHAAAAGFTLKNEHVEVFYKNLLDFAESKMDDVGKKVIELEAEIKSEEINFENFDRIQIFEPFGVDNRKPLFLVANMEIRDMAAVGKEQKHLQLTIADPESGKFFKCIAFNFGKAVHQFRRGQKIDLACEMISDVWNGVRNLKLRIVDLRLNELGAV